METCQTKGLYTNSSLTIAKNWKQPKLPSTDEWINKLWEIHTVETYTAIKKQQHWWLSKVLCRKKPGTKAYALYDSIYLTSGIGRSVISRGSDGWEWWGKEDWIQRGIVLWCDRNLYFNWGVAFNGIHLPELIKLRPEKGAFCRWKLNSKKHIFSKHRSVLFVVQKERASF